MSACLFQHLLLGMPEPTRSDDDIEAEIFTIALFSTFLTFFPLDRTFEPWIQIAFVTEPSPEECANALDITIEIPLSRTSFSFWSTRCSPSRNSLGS